MVLLTHKLQGSSHVLLPCTLPTWTKGLIIKRPVTTVRFVGKKEKHLRLKQNCRFSGGLKAKSFKVTSFKGGIQNTSLSYTSETEDSITGQPAIQKLFKKWLTMLRTQVIDEALGSDQIPQTTKPETESEIKKTESLESTRNPVWTWFWSLDAAIKIPLLLFVPAFLAVNAIYGAEVTKELSPLWIAGPLIVALYIKTFKGLCALYAFCFNQTINMIRNLPSYYLVAYHYMSQGKLRDDVIRPVMAIKNTDYKELTRAKLKQFREWIVENYLDVVESIWPYYCRTIRFLKRANLI